MTLDANTERRGWIPRVLSNRKLRRFGTAIGILVGLLATVHVIYEAQRPEPLTF